MMRGRAHTANLKAAFLRLGLMKAYHSGAVYGRTPYAAILKVGHQEWQPQKQLKCKVSSNASQIYADISGWIMDGAYAVTPRQEITHCIPRREQRLRLPLTVRAS